MSETYNILIVNDKQKKIEEHLNTYNLPIAYTQVMYADPTKEWLGEQTLEHKIDALFVHVESELERYCNTLNNFLYESGEKFPACIYQQAKERAFYTWSSSIEENVDQHPFIEMISELTITYNYNEASIEDAIKYKIQSKQLG